MNLTNKSKELGVSKSTLWRWLNGTMPSPLAKKTILEKDPELYKYLQENVWEKADGNN